ncbi:MAG: group III truncated hemoglobin [Hyphomonadaceae bacterium]
MQDRAASIGVTEAYISTLVETFYQRIHTHAQLGPIFERTIGDDDWERHLATMKRFWSSVALSTGHYSGQPVPKHKAIAGIEEHHFALWLDLFEQTLTDTAPSAEASAYFMERANRIAESLKLALFWTPQE